jgi:hypothetical protein
VGVPVGLAEPEAEWKKSVDKINEIWSVLVTAHKKVYSGNLLSYTVFAVPVHLHKEHKFRALERQVLQEMGTYLDQVRCPHYNNTHTHTPTHTHHRTRTH